MIHSLAVPTFRAFALAAAALVLAGCAALEARREAGLDPLLAAGRYQDAAVLSERQLGLPAPKSDGSLAPLPPDGSQVLGHLEAGQAWRLAGNAARSVEHFDVAEAALKRVELTSGLVQGGRQAAAVLFNDSALDYVPSPAEAVLINYYKALDFLALGRRDDARVELNRAEERIRRAVDRYADEIADAQRAARRDGRGVPQEQVQRDVAANFPEMAQWRTYRDFVVPPATYLHALFLGRSGDGGDQSAAATLYARLVDLTEGNAAVQADAREARSGRICPQDDCVWILAEQGLGPVREERRFTQPVFTLSGPLTIDLALPALVSRDGGGSLRVRAQGREQMLPEFASMDRVLQTEFAKRFPAAVTRAVVSATAKAVAQYQIDRKAGPLVGVLANLATIATTGADLRCWRSVPDQFALLRLRRAEAQDLMLETGGAPVEVKLPPAGAVLVHVTALDRLATPVVEVLPI